MVARAPTMAQVEFITYRDDVSGNISCGTLKEPMPVYVTWRPGTDGKTARASRLRSSSCPSPSEHGAGGKGAGS